MYTTSALGRFQAFNDPEAPMEALAWADQNKMLNAISISADGALRHSARVELGVAIPSNQPAAAREALARIRRCLSDTHKAFLAQCKRRDYLVAAITSRLRIESDLEYEKFFIRYYARLTRTERFEFDQIRALTEGPLVQGNKAVLEILEEHPDLLDKMPLLVDLRQHLVFWVNKYERVFVRTPGMCLLYTGVEDGVPFPPGIDRTVASLIGRFKDKPASR